MLSSLPPLPVLGLATIVCACSDAQPPPPSPPPQPAVSYDGRYVGTIRSATSIQNQTWCATPPSLTVLVSANTLSYSLSHPNLPHEPFYSPNFAIHIAPDGSFNGPGGDLAIATMTGQITGSHMTGEIDGMDCSYEFAADRR
jgi:hypothetical protein